MALTAEFTVEPFVPGAPGPHVLAAIDEARRQGARVDVGPFGTAVSGPTDDLVLSALDAALRAAVAAGATAVNVRVEVAPGPIE